MQAAINARTFAEGLDAADLARAAGRAGFEAVELMLGESGLLTIQTERGRCSEVARIFADAGVRIASLATGLFGQVNYGHEDPAVRERAKDLTRTGLDMAGWLGTDAFVVIPAFVGRWNEASPRVAYCDALSRSLDALASLAGEAEWRGVSIAIENAWNRFLLSPVEMCELIDRVNSPWVGACFDIGNAMAFGYPQDWIRTLGRRIVRVHAKDYDLERPGIAGFDCPLMTGSVDWTAVVGALREVGYDGPVIYEGRGEVEWLGRQMRRILGMG